MQSIYHFLGGLKNHIQKKMTVHKVNMRTVGAVANWDYTSLVTTIQLAITIGTQPIYTSRATSIITPPIHLRHSALANPIHHTTTTTTSATSSSSDSSRPQTRQQTRKRKDISEEIVSNTEEKGGCINHPKSTTHTTETCRKELAKQRKANSPPQSKPVTGKQVPAVALPTSQRQQPQQPRQQRQPQTRSRSSTSNDLSHIQCFRCQQWGHFANTCPQSQQQSTSNNQGNNNNNRSRNNSRARRARIGFTDKNDVKEFDASTPVVSSSPATSVVGTD